MSHAEDKISSASQHITDAIDDIMEANNQDMMGSENFSDSYMESLFLSIIKLRKIRRDLLHDNA